MVLTIQEKCVILAVLDTYPCLIIIGEEKTMGVTKKSKKVHVTLVETRSYYAKYICPSCHVEYRGGGVNKSTVSFKCDCGQVLVVESIVPASSGTPRK